jgi:hypothetical protein
VPFNVVGNPQGPNVVLDWMNVVRNAVYTLLPPVELCVILYQDSIQALVPRECAAASGSQHVFHAHRILRA